VKALLEFYSVLYRYQPGVKKGVRHQINCKSPQKLQQEEILVRLRQTILMTTEVQQRQSSNNNNSGSGSNSWF